MPYVELVRTFTGRPAEVAAEMEWYLGATADGQVVDTKGRPYRTIHLAARDDGVITVLIVQMMIDEGE